MVKDKFPYFTNPSWPYFIALIQVLYFFKNIIYLLTAHQHLCDSAPLTIFPKFLNMEPIVRVQLQLKGMKFFSFFWFASPVILFSAHLKCKKSAKFKIQ